MIWSNYLQYGFGSFATGFGVKTTGKVAGLYGSENNCAVFAITVSNSHISVRGNGL
jgi:hypothetical protein